jgi:Fic family protein
MYKPPFDITNSMLNKIISITEKVSMISSFNSLKRMPILRKNNKIRSIHSSLTIEANSLSIKEVEDVIDGKKVLGPEKEIIEVKNAYKAYSMIEEFDGYKESDLLKAHKILTNSLIEDNGKYRNHGEGVYDGEKLIFMAPPQDMVPTLMKDLFSWLNNDNETPILIKSCVFHYEFVFIHPFSDGNGRVARLWQNVLLTKWKPFFEYVPLESQIEKYQSEYYDTISKCNKNGNSNLFIEFMLKMLDETLDNVLMNLSKEVNNISIQVNRLLEVMDKDIPLTANEIMKRLNIKSKETLRNSYLNPALENGLIKMTIPDKPNSKNQRYVRR